MPSMEIPVEFSCKGDTLRGIVHSPSNAVDALSGIVFLNSGLDSRVGPGRIYVNGARRFSDAGIASLRYDFPGVSNSDGAHAERTLDVWADTTSTHLAIDLLCKQTGTESVILIGSCTGARHAVWAARRDDRIRGLILISMPVSYEGVARPKRAGQGGGGKKNGWRKSPIVQRFKATPVGSLMRQGLSLGKNVGSKHHSAVSETETYPATGSANNHQDPVLREGIYSSCVNLMQSGRPICFLMGEDDTPVVEDFNRHFGKHTAGETNELALLRHRFFAKTGHVFYGMDVQDQLFDYVFRWFEESSLIGVAGE